LSGEVEADEVYVVAGHKGHPEIVAELGREGRRRRLKGKRGRGTLADEKPPILGLLQRDGEVVIRMLPNVQQVTINYLLPASLGCSLTIRYQVAAMSCSRCQPRQMTVMAGSPSDLRPKKPPSWAIQRIT
jgi:hypothetical protein